MLASQAPPPLTNIMYSVQEVNPDLFPAITPRKVLQSRGVLSRTQMHPHEHVRTGQNTLDVLFPSKRPSNVFYFYFLNILRCRCPSKDVCTFQNISVDKNTDLLFCKTQYFEDTFQKYDVRRPGGAKTSSDCTEA